jgi:energy-coupling factor transporter transmembrane protein EcfT
MLDAIFSYLIPVICVVALLAVAKYGLQRIVLLVQVFAITFPCMILANIWTKLTWSKSYSKKAFHNDPVKVCSDRIWTVDGLAGIKFAVTMTVVKALKSNKLALFSPVYPQDHTVAEL